MQGGGSSGAIVGNLIEVQLTHSYLLKKVYENYLQIYRGSLDSLLKRSYNCYNEVILMTFGQQKIKGGIFDLDETIIDSLGTYTEAFNVGTKIFGLEPVTEKKIAHFLDKGFRLGRILVELFPSVFEDDRNRRTCEDNIRNAYLELEAQKVVLKPGVKRTLQLLKEGGVKIGIVTGRMTEGERKWRELRRLNIHQFSILNKK